MKSINGLILASSASFFIAAVSGCTSTSEESAGDERIEAFEVKLTTASQPNAEAVANLALVVERPGTPSPFRQVHAFREIRYEQGQTQTIKIKTDKTIRWVDRDELTLSISTRSEDGYLPSQIWIATVSDMGTRYTLRDAEWRNKMFSTEKDDPEAVPPVVAASEWVIPRQY